MADQDSIYDVFLSQAGENLAKEFYRPQEVQVEIARRPLPEGRRGVTSPPPPPFKGGSCPAPSGIWASPL